MKLLNHSRQPTPEARSGYNGTSSARRSCAQRWTHMRSFMLLCLLTTGVLSGCSTYGPVRVSLRLQSSDSVTAGSTDGSPTVQKATKLLETVLKPLGLRPTELPGAEARGLLHYYLVSHSPTFLEGATNYDAVAVVVRPTREGIAVSVGQLGSLREQPEARRVLADVRSAFIKSYGRRNVKTSWELDNEEPVHFLPPHAFTEAVLRGSARDDKES